MAEATDTTPSPEAGVTVDQAASRIDALFGDAPEDDRRPVEDKDQAPVDDELDTDTPDDSLDSDSAEQDDDEVSDEEAEQDDDEQATAESEEDADFTLADMSVDDLAEAMETTPEELLKMKITTKVDGKVAQVTLDELRAGYQSHAYNTQNSQRLAAERKDFQADRDAAAAHFERNNAVMANIMQELHGLFLQPLDEGMLAQLAQDDPVRWSQVKEQHRETAEKFQAALGKAAEAYDQNQAYLQQENQKSFEAFRERENAALLENVPKWNEEMRLSLHKFAMERYGFTQEDMNVISDNRIVRLALDAQKYHDSKASEGTGQARLAKVPKMGKGGKKQAKRTKAQERADRIRSAKARLRSSGKVDDAAAAIFERLP